MVDVSLTERNIVLVAHIVAAVLFLGPVTVATSLFPRYARRGEWAVARALHRISRGYGLATLAIPVFGLWLAARLEYLGLLWINLSLALFIGAFLLLVGLIVPRQARVLVAEPGGDPERADIATLRATSGLFAMVWIVILSLMVAKPS